MLKCEIKTILSSQTQLASFLSGASLALILSFAASKWAGHVIEHDIVLHSLDASSIAPFLNVQEA